MLVKVLLVAALSATVGAVPHCHPEPPPHPPEPPPLHPPKPPEPRPRPPEGGGEVPPVGGLSSAGQSLERESSDDEQIRRIVCFAYDTFYDDETGEVNVPTQDEFVQDVLDEVLPDSPPDRVRAKADDVYDLLVDLEDGDLGAVAADVGCF